MNIHAPQWARVLSAAALLAACNSEEAATGAATNGDGVSSPGGPGQCDMARYEYGPTLLGKPEDYGTNGNACTIRVSGDEASDVGEQTVACNVIFAFAHNHTGIDFSYLSLHYFPPDWDVTTGSGAGSQAQVGFDLLFSDLLEEATPLTVTETTEERTLEAVFAYYMAEPGGDRWYCENVPRTGRPDGTFELNVESIASSCSINEEIDGKSYYWKKYVAHGSLRAACPERDRGVVSVEIDF